MRFDYLHSARPLFLQRILELRIPERFHTPLFALLGSVVIVAGAWGIESVRLREALKVQSVYELQYDGAQRRLKDSNLYYERVEKLVDLDRHVRRIAISGDTDARVLAEIANQLPQHAWLTGISHDTTGLALAGRAKDLQVLSAVMRGLMHAKDLRSPMLESAQFDKEPGSDGAMKYSIHVDGVAR